MYLARSRGTGDKRPIWSVYVLVTRFRDFKEASWDEGE